MRRANRNAKQNLEMDWSHKWEASVADARAANRRNEDVDIMFYPGVARHYDKSVISSIASLSLFSLSLSSVNRHLSPGLKILTITLSMPKIN